MKKPLISSCFLIFFSAAMFVSSWAQSNKLGEEVSAWYLEERFILADNNNDARLDKGEMENFSNEFTYFLEDRYFEIADQNKDGYLSFNDIYKRRESEFLYRFSMDRKSLRDVGREYPMLAQADLKYYKDNPDMVSKLFSNFAWMVENRDLATRLYSDRSWTGRNTEVVASLQKNLLWMAAHPGEAQVLYRNRAAAGQLPHLLSWRADHQEFIRQHPKLDNMYELEFLPDALKLAYKGQ